jgi:pyridinium-3,5-biscarboxylic acid mononucleotide sulfurtransferase
MMKNTSIKYNRLQIELEPDLGGKWRRLQDILNQMGSAVVAFSGGVDSALVSAATYETLGNKMVAFTICSPVEAPGDSQKAEFVALEYGFPHQLIEFNDLEDKIFLSNPPDRCYFCKSRRLAALRKLADDLGFENILDGSNAGDLNQYRPGMRALAEAGARSPLIEAGIDKAGVRRIARLLGLSVWNRPSSPCLATRFPYGTKITGEGLRQVGEAETFLRGLGFEVTRVRHYGTLARLEVTEADIDSAFAQREQIGRALKEIGYTHIALDLIGYRSGSMDEGLPL